MPTIFENINLFILLSGLLILYAEIHFRIPGIFSRYFKKEPEIIADVPHRIGPGKKLPVLILIKDAFKYPIVLEKVIIGICSPSNNQKIEFVENSVINSKWWYKVFEINFSNESQGPVKINVRIVYSINKKQKFVNNDNYRLTHKKPFDVYIDSMELPKTKNWYFGDLHSHTNLTDDQVEFGAPLPATVQMAKSMGINFIAATDHSYDLDDAIDNYLVNDPKFPKWKKLWEQVNTLNQQEADVKIIAGEELSAGNSNNKNVHFLILNNQKFFIGTGDGAEKWLRNKPETSIPQVVKNLENNAVSFAAHPEADLPLSQKLLLRRGKWTDSDYKTNGLTGLQIWNSKKDAAFYCGVKKWVDLLLLGHRIYIVAGNDAHGNFGRFRQLSTPFVSMSENNSELFGKVRTGLFIRDKLSVENIISSLKAGKIIVTDGPFANLELTSENRPCGIGGNFTKGKGTMRIVCKSSSCFGELYKLVVFIGDLDEQKETTRYTYYLPLGLYGYYFEKKIFDLPTKGYIRVAVESRKENIKHLCLTNPIFMSN